MAKGTSDAVRLKAKQMREAQEHTDRRTRTFIIATVVVIVVAIVGALIWVVQSQSVSHPQSGQSGAYSTPAKFEDGKPIVVSDKGVGQKNPDLDDLTIYYSYTCHWCAYLEENVGTMLADDAKAGKFNLVLQPVNTIEMPWQGPATSAALVVADQDPDHFLAFHLALFDYFSDRFNAQDGSVLQDLDASVKKIADIAKEQGISKDVIEKFGIGAPEYLKEATTTWMDANIEGRGNQLGTPELVFNNAKQISWGQGEPDAIHQQILDGLKEAGLKG